jgi:hypothetical protein
MMGVRFTNDEVKRMAIYIAQLTREGIAYTVAETSDGWVITATGF